MHNVRRVVYGLLVLRGLTAVSLAAAQQPAAPPSGGPRIAFVNIQAVLEQTPGYAQAESTYAKEATDAQAAMTKLQSALDSAMANFQQQQSILSPTNRAAKRKELETQQQQYQQKGLELQNKLNQRRADLLGPIQQRVSAVIDGLRAEGNFAVIFDVSAPGGNIISADPALDLSPKVLERLQVAQGK